MFQQKLKKVISTEMPGIRLSPNLSTNQIVYIKKPVFWQNTYIKKGQIYVNNYFGLFPTHYLTNSSETNSVLLYMYY